MRIRLVNYNPWPGTGFIVYEYEYVDKVVINNHKNPKVIIDGKEMEYPTARIEINSEHES